MEWRRMVGAVRIVAVVCVASVLSAANAAAGGQVDTGRITGTVTDNSSAVLPGVTVSLSGDSLIGGVQGVWS